MKREEHIEHQVRQRLAEVLSSVGVGYDRVSVEVLYMLPPAFIEAYVELYNEAFKDASAGVKDPNAIPVKRTRRSQMPVVGDNAGKRYREHWLIDDDRAFGRKRRIDAKLNKLAREMRTGIREEQNRIRCDGCGRWVEGRWRYCAWCGYGGE